MRLGTTDQSDTLGTNASALAESKIGFSRIPTRIHLLLEVEVTKLGTHHGVYDVLEVVVSPILTLERRSP